MCGSAYWEKCSRTQVGFAIKEANCAGDDARPLWIQNIVDRDEAVRREHFNREAEVVEQHVERMAAVEREETYLAATLENILRSHIQ